MYLKGKSICINSDIYAINRNLIRKINKYFSWMYYIIEYHNLTSLI